MTIANKGTHLTKKVSVVALVLLSRTVCSAPPSQLDLFLSATQFNEIDSTSTETVVIGGALFFEHFNFDYYKFTNCNSIKCVELNASLSDSQRIDYEAQLSYVAGELASNRYRMLSYSEVGLYSIDWNNDSPQAKLYFGLTTEETTHLTAQELVKKAKANSIPETVVNVDIASTTGIGGRFTLDGFGFNRTISTKILPPKEKDGTQFGYFTFEYALNWEDKTIDPINISFGIKPFTNPATSYVVGNDPAINQVFEANVRIQSENYVEGLKNVDIDKNFAAIRNAISEKEYLKAAELIKNAPSVNKVNRFEIYQRELVQVIDGLSSSFIDDQTNIQYVFGIEKYKVAEELNLYSNIKSDNFNRASKFMHQHRKLNELNSLLLMSESKLALGDKIMPPLIEGQKYLEVKKLRGGNFRIANNLAQWKTNDHKRYTKLAIDKVPYVIH